MPSATKTIELPSVADKEAVRRFLVREALLVYKSAPDARTRLKALELAAELNGDRLPVRFEARRTAPATTPLENETPRAKNPTRASALLGASISQRPRIGADEVLASFPEEDEN